MLNIKREAIVIDPSYLYEENSPELMAIINFDFATTDTELLAHTRGVDTLPVQVFWGEGIYIASTVNENDVQAQEFCVDSGIYCVFDADDFEKQNPGLLATLNSNNYARLKVSGEVERKGSMLIGALVAGSKSDSI